MTPTNWYPHHALHSLPQLHSKTAEHVTMCVYFSFLFPGIGKSIHESKHFNYLYMHVIYLPILSTQTSFKHVYLCDNIICTLSYN